MFTLVTHCGENKLWQQQNVVFAIMPHSFLVGPYVFFRPYHFDAYGPHTGPFLLWFCNCARGRTGHMIKVLTLLSRAFRSVFLKFAKTAVASRREKRTKVRNNS